MLKPADVGESGEDGGFPFASSPPDLGESIVELLNPRTPSTVCCVVWSPVGIRIVVVRVLVIRLQWWSLVLAGNFRATLGPA